MKDRKRQRENRRIRNREAISANARETAYDKVKKLILNDTEMSENRKAS